MNKSWSAGCTLTSGTWWKNWKELVFYSVASAYEPRNPNNLPICGSCLTVSPPAATADKQVVVMIASKTLGAQLRGTISQKQNATNYLEVENDGGSPDTFTKQSVSAGFNDYVLFR